METSRTTQGLLISLSTRFRSDYEGWKLRGGNYHTMYPFRVVLEVTMRDGNSPILISFPSPLTPPRFRSDYEGWKQAYTQVKCPYHVEHVLEVTMRDGNGHRTVKRVGVVLVSF